MIRVNLIAGLPTTEAGFEMIQNHVDLHSGKVHAVPTRVTATAADPAAIIRDICLRSGYGFPDVLVVDHDSKFTSEVFRAFVKGWGSSLIVGSAYHKNTNANIEHANGIVSDTLRAFANGRKDDWDGHLPLAVFAINNVDAWRRPDALFHRPRRAPPAPAVASSRRPCRRRFPCTLRATHAGDGGDGTGDAGGGAG
jgi:hypothetical protein